MKHDRMLRLEYFVQFLSKLCNDNKRVDTSSTGQIEWISRIIALTSYAQNERQLTVLSRALIILQQLL